jgi:hypothetical protein
VQEARRRCAIRHRYYKRESCSKFVAGAAIAVNRDEGGVLILRFSSNRYRPPTKAGMELTESPVSNGRDRYLEGIRSRSEKSKGAEGIDGR